MPICSAFGNWIDRKTGAIRNSSENQTITLVTNADSVRRQVRFFPGHAFMSLTRSRIFLFASVLIAAIVISLVSAINLDSKAHISIKQANDQGNVLDCCYHAVSG